MTASTLTRTHDRSRRGTSLIEVVVAMVLMATLLTAILPTYGTFVSKDQNRRAAARADDLDRYVRLIARNTGGDNADPAAMAFLTASASSFSTDATITGIADTNLNGIDDDRAVQLSLGGRTHCVEWPGLTAVQPAIITDGPCA